MTCICGMPIPDPFINDFWNTHHCPCGRLWHKDSEDYTLVQIADPYPAHENRYLAPYCQCSSCKGHYDDVNIELLYQGWSAITFAGETLIVNNDDFSHVNELIDRDLHTLTCPCGDPIAIGKCECGREYKINDQDDIQAC